MSFQSARAGMGMLRCAMFELMNEGCVWACGACLRRRRSSRKCDTRIEAILPARVQEWDSEPRKPRMDVRGGKERDVARDHEGVPQLTETGVRA